MKANTFRVIRKDLLEAYKSGDLSSVPNLEGYNFNAIKRVNTYDYDHTKKYLHFFSSYSVAKQYLDDLPKTNNDEYIICEFHFDSEFLRQNKFKGRYYSKEEMKEIFRDEYIFSTEHYSKENFLKIASPDDYSKEYGYDPDSYSSGWFF